jgi:3-hydroxyisobutyrate dehydrogenase
VCLSAFIVIDSFGVIGAGLMGMGMAESAARAGLQVAVRDIDPARERLARERGLAVLPTPAALAGACQAIALVVLDAAQIETVLHGPDGLLGALQPAHLVLVCSTISPEDSSRFCAAMAGTGAGVLDAPISGGPARAQAGTMSMMLAGSPATLARAEPLLAVLAARRFLIGERLGDAARAKLVNNLMAGIHLLAGAEAMALGERLGLDPARLLDLVSASSGQSWMFDDRMPRALAGDLAPRAQSHVLTKDVRLANEAARAVGLDLPLGAPAAALMQAVCDGGWRDQDDAAALAYYRERFARTSRR